MISAYLLPTGSELTSSLSRSFSASLLFSFAMMSGELMARSMATFPDDLTDGTPVESIFAPPGAPPPPHATPKAAPQPPAGAAGATMSSATGKPETLMEAFDQFRFPRELRLGVMKLVGATSEDDDPELLAYVPADVVQEGLSSWVLEDGSTPTMFQVGHVHKFFKQIRRTFKEPAPDLPPPTAPPPPQNIFVKLADDSEKLQLCDFIDQTVKGTFEVLPAAEIAQLRQRLVDIIGVPPPSEEKPSDEQISALAHRVRVQNNGRMNPPWVEFAIFGPYGSRTARMRQFTAHVLTRDGTWSQKTLRGPSSYAQWEAAWTVFANTMIMLDLASPGSLQQYQRGIRRLDRLFPGDWPSIAALDEEVRYEQWGQLYQEICAAPVGNRPAVWDPQNPSVCWNYIIAASRSNFLAGPLADWWRDRETILDRARQNRPGRSGILHDLVPPAFPASQGQRVIPELAGTSSGNASSSTQALEDAPRKQTKKPKNKFQQKVKQAKGKGKGKNKKTNNNEQRCWTCGNPNHLQKDCPTFLKQQRAASEEAKRRKKQKGNKTKQSNK